MVVMVDTVVDMEVMVDTVMAVNLASSQFITPKSNYTTLSNIPKNTFKKPNPNHYIAYTSHIYRYIPHQKPQTNVDDNCLFRICMRFY